MTRFRYGLAARSAAGIFLVGMLALAGQTLFLLPLVLIPLAVLAYAIVAGVDVDDKTVRVRALVGRRAVPWESVTGVDRRGARVSLLLTGDRALLLPPMVRPADVPRLLAAGGQSYDATGEPTTQ